MEAIGSIGGYLDLTQGVLLCTRRVCTFGFGSLSHGIWPLIKGIGTKNLGLLTLRVQT